MSFGSIVKQSSSSSRNKSSISSFRLTSVHPILRKVEAAGESLASQGKLHVTVALQPLSVEILLLVKQRRLMSDYTALYETLQQEDTISEADLSKLRALSDLSYSSLPNYEQRKRDSVCLARSRRTALKPMLAIERAREPRSQTSEDKSSLWREEGCES